MTAVDVLLKERAALCDALAETGPEAPTLCAGWLTADLAAHLLALGETSGRGGRHHPPRTVRRGTWRR